MFGIFTPNPGEDFFPNLTVASFSDGWEKNHHLVHLSLHTTPKTKVEPTNHPFEEGRPSELKPPFGFKLTDATWAGWNWRWNDGRVAWKPGCMGDRNGSSWRICFYVFLLKIIGNLYMYIRISIQSVCETMNVKWKIWISSILSFFYFIYLGLFGFDVIDLIPFIHTHENQRNPRTLSKRE